MNKIMLLVLLTIIMIAVAVPFVIRSLLWNRVLKLLHNGQYDKVLIMLNSKAFQLFFKEYDRNWNTLRVYLAQGNNRKIEEQTKKLLDSRLTNAQAYQIASQTYFYFLDRENRDVCERLLSYIEKSAGEEELLYDRMLFRIMIEKKSEDIAEMEALLEKKEAEKIKKRSKAGSAGTDGYSTISAWTAVFLPEKPPTDGAVSEQSQSESEGYAIP